MIYLLLITTTLLLTAIIASKRGQRLHRVKVAMLGVTVAALGLAAKSTSLVQKTCYQAINPEILKGRHDGEARVNKNTAPELRIGLRTAGLELKHRNEKSLDDTMEPTCYVPMMQD